MAEAYPLDTTWSLGMRRDGARDGSTVLIGGSGWAWNIVDLIPEELEAPLRKRGGWTYTGAPMLTVTQMGPLCWAPFTGGSKLVGVDQGNAMWDILTPNNVGIMYDIVQNPFFYRDKVIFPNADGVTAINYYDGTAISALTGAFPGKFGGVFKDHAVLACSADNPQRLAFSDPADPTTWDLVLQVWDASFPLKAVGFIRNGMLLFQESRTEYLSGSIPPPGGDLIMTKLIDVGCLDPQSVVNWNDQCIWASAEGIFQTDGSKVLDLTATGGMSSYWRDVFLSNYTSTGHIVSGIFRGHLLVTVLDANYNAEDTLVFNLTNHTFVRFSNFPMAGAAQVHTAPEECYVSMGPRVAQVSSCWTPGVMNEYDGDGTPVTWTLESGLHRGFLKVGRRYFPAHSIQNWKTLYPNYDMRVNLGAPQPPTIRISVLDTPEATTYTDITNGTGQSPDLSSTTALKRLRVILNHASNGLAYKMVQSGPSSDTRIYAMEAQYSGREGSSVR